MASTIIIKNSSTASSTPATGDLVQGELAVNVTDKKIFTKDSTGAIITISDASVAASTSASAAATSATNAASSATSAASSATSAASAKTAAEAARDATLAAYDSFDDRYLGAKTSDPSVDNDGNALVAGALYFNSSTQVMMLYTGSSWVAAYVSGANYVTLTGTQTLTNKTFTGYTETVYNLSGTSIDVANGSIQYKTLSGNTTFTEALADGQSVVLMLNPSTYTVTWPTITWIGNVASTAPTLIASVYNCITLFQIAGTVYGKYEGRV
jgi:hypothetical protein